MGTQSMTPVLWARLVGDFAESQHAGRVWMPGGGVTFKVELERDDGRWIAEVPVLDISFRAA